MPTHALFLPCRRQRWLSVCSALLVLCGAAPLALRAAPDGNPFEKFIGEWTLKDDNWTQNWGGGLEHIKISGHHTVCRAVNTENSLLAVIDGAPPHGHIFWTYNRATGEVRHLSSFGQTRSGVGTGSVNERGDVALKVSFEDEPPGTYRRYVYRWINDDEYELSSTHYGANDQPTGWFYGGTFVRLSRRETDRQKVAAIFARHDEVYRHADDVGPGLDAYLRNVADDVILMPHDARAIEGKPAYRRHIEESFADGRMTIRHELIELYSFAETVIVRGRAVGTFTPRGQTVVHSFETKNLFVFRRTAGGELQVWQIIFNHSPAKRADAG